MQSSIAGSVWRRRSSEEIGVDGDGLGIVLAKVVATMLEASARRGTEQFPLRTQSTAPFSTWDADACANKPAPHFTEPPSTTAGPAVVLAGHAGLVVLAEAGGPSEPSPRTLSSTSGAYWLARVLDDRTPTAGREQNIPEKTPSEQVVRDGLDRGGIVCQDTRSALLSWPPARAASHVRLRGCVSSRRARARGLLAARNLGVVAPGLGALPRLHPDVPAPVPGADGRLHGEGPLVRDPRPGHTTARRGRRLGTVGLLINWPGIRFHRTLQTLQSLVSSPTSRAIRIGS